jgi:hypothetical protein
MRIRSPHADPALKPVRRDSVEPLTSFLKYSLSVATRLVGTLAPPRKRSLGLVAGLFGSLAAQAAGFSDRFDTFKTNASPADLYRLLYAMPKAGDLHHHAALQQPP